MTRRARASANAKALLRALCADPEARLVEGEGDSYAFKGRSGRRFATISGEQVKRLAGSGLLADAEPGAYAATEAAAAWLKRQAELALPFHAQHAEIAPVRIEADARREVLANLDESPVAALARAGARGGAPWLAAHAASAADRLRRDFETGRLQPRVTANWSASVSDGRRSGDNSGLADLTDAALGARLRFERAVRAVGPELSGVLVDVCCFLKGLQTVERERQWPARSAKLVLRLALERLAGHYGLAPAATGRSGSRKVHHWGSDDFRPRIS